MIRKYSHLAEWYSNPSLQGYPSTPEEGSKKAAKENDRFDVVLQSGTRVKIFKNPTPDDYGELKKAFREEYPLAPPGTPSTRSTKDEEGNTYVWSSDYIHQWIEPLLEKKTGLRMDQNGYFE